MTSYNHTRYNTETVQYFKNTITQTADFHKKTPITPKRYIIYGNT